MERLGPQFRASGLIPISPVRTMHKQVVVPKRYMWNVTLREGTTQLKLGIPHGEDMRELMNYIAHRYSAFECGEIKRGRKLP